MRTKGRKKLRVVRFPSDPPLLSNPRLKDLTNGAVLEFVTLEGVVIIKLQQVSYVGAFSYLLRGFMINEEYFGRSIEMLYNPDSGVGTLHILGN